MVVLKFLPLPHRHVYSSFSPTFHPHFTPQVIIAGNHDLTFDSANYDTLWKRFSHSRKYDCEYLKSLIKNAPDVTYLEDEGTTINGIRIWGSPW